VSWTILTQKGQLRYDRKYRWGEIELFVLSRKFRDQNGAHVALGPSKIHPFYDRGVREVRQKPVARDRTVADDLAGADMRNACREQDGQSDTESFGHLLLKRCGRSALSI
jgi:hypothetical protein